MKNNFRLCTLRSSSKGNATIIYNEKTKIMVDCGVSGKAVEECLCSLGICADDVDAIVVTHEHIDHIKGVGILSRKHNIPIYANEATWNAMIKNVGRIERDNIKVFRTNSEFLVGDINVRSFDIPHDAAEPVGYTFELNDEKLAVATDMGEVRENIRRAVKGSREILLEANYDTAMLDMGAYPYELKRRIKGKLGHLSNSESGDFACELAENGAKSIILGHLSWENNYPDLAFYTVKNALIESGIDVERDIALSVALRDGVGSAKYENMQSCKNIACG